MMSSNLISFPHSSPAAQRTPALSVVIIGRNEGERLRRCLQSVGRIRGGVQPIEVIYVDSASTDESPQVAANLHAEVIVLDQGKCTAARGRNAGWRKALAPYVLFLDGDTILHPDFVRAALTRLEDDPSIAAVWGHRRELYPQSSIYNRVADLDWIYAPGFTEYCGGDVLMRRSALSEVEGFDADLIAGEEPELCRRLRAQHHRILHIDAPMTLHDLGLKRFGQYWWHAVRAGYAYADIAQRFRHSMDPMWMQESQRNVRAGAFWMVWLVIAISTVAFAGAWGLLSLLVPLVFAARSGWKARAKAPGQPFLLFCYGLHSHLQQIPILFGQLKYRADRRFGKQRNLIEYKQGAGV